MEKLRANLRTARASVRRLRDNRQWLEWTVTRVKRNLERVKVSAINRQSRSAEEAAIRKEKSEWVCGQIPAAPQRGS